MYESVEYSKDFLVRLKGRSLTLLLAATSLPIVLLLVNLAPPWPSQFSATTLAVLVQLGSSMALFGFLARPSKSLAQGISAASAAIGALGLAVYVVLLFNYTAAAPDWQHRVVTGFEQHPEIRELVAAEPELTQERLLMAFGFEPRAIWTYSSILIVRISILVAWLVCCCCSALFVVSLVRHRQIK
ncbi:MAG: hypothetical protein HQ582_07885 [Planctomycetes bacterium]|nr:hypothetical protein [Planctomycetota bacterium]